MAINIYVIYEIIDFFTVLNFNTGIFKFMNIVKFVFL